MRDRPAEACANNCAAPDRSRAQGPRAGAFDKAPKPGTSLPAARRPRASRMTHPRGSRAAPGLRPRALGPAARSSLMGRGSAGRSGNRRHAMSLLQKRGPAPETDAACGAPQGARASQDARHDNRRQRLAALRSLGFCVRGDPRIPATPRRPKNRGDGARPRRLSLPCKGRVDPSGARIGVGTGAPHPARFRSPPSPFGGGIKRGAGV